ncbi:MAG: hypothetical protein JW725_01645 [Candidatus Babeliaceae bacterium]|nr:hypothetical protein [Candidatus Babeliaceae bacterium]
MKFCSLASFARFLSISRFGVLFLAFLQCIGWIYFWIFAGTFSYPQRMLGLIVDGVALWLLLSSLGNVFHLLGIAQKGQLLVSPVAHFARRAALFLLGWTAYAPVQRALELLIETMHNPVGQRELAFSIGTTDLIRFMIFAGLMLFAFAVQQGVALREDQIFTV